MATRAEIQARIQAMEGQVDSKMAAGAGPDRDRIKGILESLGDAWGTPPSSPQLDSASDRCKSKLGEIIKGVMKNLLTALGTPTVGAEVPTAACGGGGGGDVLLASLSSFGGSVPAPDGSSPELIALPNPAAADGSPVSMFFTGRIQPTGTPTQLDPDLFGEFAIDGTTVGTVTVVADTLAVTDGNQVELVVSGHCTTTPTAGNHTFSFFLTNSSGQAVNILDAMLTVIQHS